MAIVTHPRPLSPTHGHRDPPLASVPPCPRSYGSWESPVLCPQGEFLTSFRLRVEPSVGIRDDTAATDMEATCAGGLVLQGKGLPWGEWGAWSRSCGSSCRVCGIRTRVDLHNFFDTSGLTDLRLYCCPHAGYGWGQPETP
uniref:Uncharacterized protein n=1 Tax=Zosterops lateralis melanops TaxID=1220523 RepID=A0A8D2P522_ZOSLA